MKVVFMGTPDFALPSLRALVEKGHRVEAVVTQPDRPGGRGKKLRPPPVKTYALEKEIPVLQPERIRNPDFCLLLKDIEPEAIIVAAFGSILPAEILALPRYGCINVHASLLPAYRGAAPIHRAVINGEKETGVTIMQMDAGLDTGDMINRVRVPIGPDDTTGEVHDRLAELGGKLLVSSLELIAGGLANPVKQDDTRSSYAQIISREDEIINWNRGALEIKNQVRGLNPWPVAQTRLGDKLLKVWRVDIQDTKSITEGKPGQVLQASVENGIKVKTGDGIVAIKELQLQGKKRLIVDDFLNGNPITVGTVLGE